MLHSFRSIRSPTPRAATHPLHHHHPAVTPPKPPPSSSSSSHHHHHHGIIIITTTPPPPQPRTVRPTQRVRLAVRVSRGCGMRLVVDSTAKGAFCFGLDPHRVRLAYQPPPTRRCRREAAAATMGCVWWAAAAIGVRLAGTATQGVFGLLFRGTGVFGFGFNDPIQGVLVQRAA
ncbi:hypothetical protein Tco_0641968 [Tanacetum coccineum]